MEAKGTYKCPICRMDSPHSHDNPDGEIERFLRSLTDAEYAYRGQGQCGECEMCDSIAAKRIATREAEQKEGER